MSWLRRLLGKPSGAPQDVAELLTTRGPLRVDSETTSLDDRETVQQWVRGLRPEAGQQVFVHRPWGTLAAVAEGRHPVSVVLSDGKDSWFATAPGATDLTPEQVEHVVLDALTSSERPQWPEWKPLI